MNSPGGSSMIKADTKKMWPCFERRLKPEKKDGSTTGSTTRWQDRRKMLASHKMNRRRSLIVFRSAAARSIGGFRMHG